MNFTVVVIYNCRYKPKIRIIIPILVFIIFTSLQVKAQNINYGRNTSGDEASRMLSSYIQHASVTGNEKAAGEYFAGLCQERGLIVKVFTDRIDSYNFAASLYPLDLNKPNIILLNHIDVVKEGDASGWINPPYSGAIIRDTVWGRGTIDMKGVAVMQLSAISSFTGKAAEYDLPVNVTLLCVSGEEMYGDMGSKIISESYFKELNPEVVLGEGGIGAKNVLSRSPDRIVFCISQSDKRALWIKLHLNYATSGHGAVPPPDYANKIMINALSSLTGIHPKIHFNRATKTMFREYGEMEKGLKGFIIRKPGLFKPLIARRLRKDPILLSTVTNTITITHFEEQENDINQIPQEITVMLDCRLIPETPTQEFLDYLRKKIKNSEIEISVIRETRNAPPTISDKYYNMLEKSIAETYPGAGIIPVLFPATTDNNYFRNLGVPVYGIVPVFLEEKLIKTIHNYNERIPVESLVLGAEVYIRFLEKLLPQSK